MIISKHEDKSFKILVDFTMADFLKGIGIEDDMVIPLPSELMATNCINRRMDYCGLSRNHEIINVEFQSTVLSKEDEIRIFDYASSLFVKYKMPVKTYILSTVEDKSRKIEKWHHNDVFTIYVISLKDKDGLEGLNRIKSKIRNNETLNGEDVVFLISIVFMNSDYDESELLFQIADLSNKARFESEFVRDQIKSILLILGDKFIRGSDESERFLRIVKMESGYLSSIFERQTERYRKEVREEFIEEGIGKGIIIGLDEGKELGREEGREEGRVEGDEERGIIVARWMLNEGIPMEEIIKVSGLSAKKINSLREEENIE